MDKMKTGTRVKWTDGRGQQRTGTVLADGRVRDDRTGNSLRPRNAKEIDA